eukprot:2906041-Pyramimonas_sp.AAC.1
MGPEDLLATGWLELVHRSIVTTPRATCGGNVRDFLIQSNLLDAFGCQVKVLEEAPMPPLSPVIVEVDGIVDEPYVRDEVACEAFP